MKRISLGFLSLALLAGSCSDDPVRMCDCQGQYLELTSPENLVNNLQVSYQRQEIQKYTEILAPEFLFKFQPQDANQMGEDTWNRNQDSTGTGALFRSPLVQDIRIALTHTGAQDPMEAGFEPGTKWIRIDPTFLEVDESSGTTWSVNGDIQDFFFRKGREAAGEDTTRWFLMEWRDIPDPFPAAARVADPTAVLGATWGIIKATY